MPPAPGCLCSMVIAKFTKQWSLRPNGGVRYIWLTIWSSSANTKSRTFCPLRCNSLLKCALHSKIARNSRGSREVQDRSWSLMLIKLKSPWPVLVMISNLCVPICNRFHTRRANSIKIASFGGYPFWRPRYQGCSCVIAGAPRCRMAWAPKGLIWPWSLRARALNEQGVREICDF